MKLLIFLIVPAILCSQLQPIPTSQDGFAIGSNSANVTLDVFYDHLCDGSASSWPSLFTYWDQNQDWLRLVVHVFPLPYHYYTYSVSRAGRFIQLNYPVNFTSYLSWMFLHQSKYLSAAEAWDQKTLYTYLSQDTQTATGVPFSLTEAALNNNTYDYNLRISWKYAASKGITGTPQFMTNGILTPGASDCDTVQCWGNFFNGLFS